MKFISFLACASFDIGTFIIFRLQEGPQNGVGAAAVDRRRGGGAHQDAQLPAVRVQPPASVVLQVFDLSARHEYHTSAAVALLAQSARGPRDSGTPTLRRSDAPALRRTPGPRTTRRREPRD